jgi:ABC-type phosphate/phosphonate transport system substrate-binding protein
LFLLETSYPSVLDHFTIIAKITAIKGWPFPVYGKISQQTANNILPKKKKEDIVNALLKLRKNKRKVEDALF